MIGEKMCSIFKYKNCVGRNFDYEVSYQEELRIIEKGEHYNDSRIIGMCTGLVDDEPLMYDGMNGYGLVCGALAFEGNAYYYPHDEDKFSPGAYEFVNYILRNFHSVEQAKDFISHDNFQIGDTQYSDDFPNSDLHWFIADKKESIVVEQTKNGLNIYNGSVMTNNPVYSVQKHEYDTYKDMIGDNEYFENLYNTRGMETSGLDGSYTSDGRFERLSFLKEQLEKHQGMKTLEPDALDVANSFHLLSSVEQIYGATPVNDKFEYTIYSIVYDMKNLNVYYKFYNNIGVLTDNL